MPSQLLYCFGGAKRLQVSVALAVKLSNTDTQSKPDHSVTLGAHTSH